LGIGHPGDKDRVIGHVLKDFAKADGAWLEAMLNAVVDNVPYLVKGDEATFMSKVALALNPPKPRPVIANESPPRVKLPGTRGTDGV
jgi:PTH1 family peptidyl-tRNA hydrolase